MDRVATFLIGRGLSSTLQTSQNALGSVANGLDSMAGLVAWKNRAASRQLLMGVVVSCGLFALVPFRYWLLFASLYIMTSQTRVFATVSTSVVGVTNWFFLSPDYVGIKSRLPQIIKVRQLKIG